MKVPKKLNAVRRKFMHSITKNIGKSSSSPTNAQNATIKKILISRPNHRLGNLLLLTPIVQEVSNSFPNTRIDLFVKGGISPTIFKNYENVDQIIQLPKKPFKNLFKYVNGWFTLRWKKYDLVINSTHGSSSGKLSTRLSNAKYKFYSEWDEELNLKHADYQHSAKNVIYNLRKFLTQLGFEDNISKIPYLSIKLDKDELEAGKRKLAQIINNDKKTICLFTNATGDKCYSEDWWNSFYTHLQSEFPEYNFVELLPVENISKLNFKIPTFYSTDIREMAAFIANTVIFIAADNGVMHLASASGTPTLGLFSVTNDNMYKPYNDKSFSVDTNQVNEKEISDLIKKTIQ